MEDIEEKAKQLQATIAAISDEIAAGVVDKFEMYDRANQAESARDPSRKLHDECNELFKRNLTNLTDPNEMRRTAWRWYAGMALSGGRGPVDAQDCAQSMLVEEQRIFGKIGGERE